MNKRWNVKISDKCAKEVQKLLKENLISREEYGIIRDWILFVQANGPYKLKEYRFYDFRPHELTRDLKWKDHHSSCFSFSGRIIYKIEDNIVTVVVVRITISHDYN